GRVRLATHVRRVALPQHFTRRDGERLNRIDAGRGRDGGVDRLPRARRLFLVEGQIRLGDIHRGAVTLGPAVAQPQRVPAQLLDVVHAVRAEQQRAAVIQVFLHL